MELVCIVPGGFSGTAVGCHTPPHGILHDEHTQLFELLAQLLDVKADDAVIDIYVGVVIENVQTALDVDFQRSRHMAGFRFVLCQQGVVQIFQQGHIFRDGVLEILAVNHMDAAVNDRLFHWLQALLAAHHQFAQGQHKVGFQSQRVVLFRVVAVDVHRIDILGTGRADVDDLPMQTLHQRSVLCFRVADDDIIVRHEERIADFTLCAEGFTGTGRAQNQTVGVLQLFAINHDEVVGKSVQTVVQAFLAVIEQFLRGKRHKNRCAAGGQPPLNFDLAVCQRQAAHQPLLLLKIKAA